VSASLFEKYDVDEAPLDTRFVRAYGAAPRGSEVPSDRILATTKYPRHIVWHQTAFCRWRYNHEVIVNASLVLLESHMPVYVLLEILDWLPGMDRQNHVRKVRLLESIRASLRTIDRRREESLSNKR